MGAWGANIYQDDLALDIKDTIMDKLKRKNTIEEITSELINEYAYILNEPEEASIFWFALADTQWNIGRLVPGIKENALKMLDEGSDLRRWQEENPKLAEKRKKVLEELRQKLNTPQPPEKKISQWRIYKCEWNIGDVFAYQFTGEEAKEKGFYLKYMYFVKVDETIWHPGHTVPVVYFYKRLDDEIATLEDLKDNEYLHQFYVPSVYEKNPNTKRRFLLALLNTSKRIIPSKQLTYLGKLEKVKRVENENLKAYETYWKYFEEYMIKNYNNWK